MKCTSSALVVKFDWTIRFENTWILKWNLTQWCNYHGLTTNASFYVHHFYYRKVFFLVGDFLFVNFVAGWQYLMVAKVPPSSLLSRFCPSIFCPHSRIPLSHTPGETLLYIYCIYIRVQNQTKPICVLKGTQTWFNFQFFASTLYLYVAQSLELKI